MSGLREKKQSERKMRIFNAAIELFGTDGFERTTMQKIAEKANLGVGTLYNYYSSKGDILLSIISDRAEGYNADFENSLKSYSSDVLTSINLFYDIYFKSFLTYSRVIWREFMSHALSKNTSLIDYVYRVDSVFIQNLAKLFELLKGDKYIKQTVDIEKAVRTLYSLIIFHILKYTTNETMSMEELRLSLDSQTCVVIEGLK